MRKLSRKFTSAVLTLALLVSLLPIGAAPAQAAETRAIVGAFEVTGNSSNYSYNDGVLTVNDGADITISMANGATTPTSDRIVVNGNAEITLNGVNITGAAYDSINGTDAQSPIDVSENATLILNLPESSQNTLIGGEGKASVGAPGIHVPDSASLVIHGKGVLSVTGGASTNAYGGNGIGGISFGGSSGSVIIFATGKVTITGGDGQGTTSDGVDIGGGLGTTDGGNGQGIRPVSGQENTYTVWGNLTLPCDITIPQGATVTIPDGASLTVPSGTKLTNNGTISVQGGAFSGEVSGTQPIAAAGYTINYADETITASNGYELSATNTETAEESQTLNLTPGEDVYIRLAELEGASWVTVDIPARPAAPAVTATIDYSGEKLSFPSG